MTPAERALLLEVAKVLLDRAGWSREPLRAALAAVEGQTADSARVEALHDAGYHHLAVPR